MASVIRESLDVIQAKLLNTQQRATFLLSISVMATGGPLVYTLIDWTLLFFEVFVSDASWNLSAVQVLYFKYSVFLEGVHQMLSRQLALTALMLVSVIISFEPSKNFKTMDFTVPFECRKISFPNRSTILCTSAFEV